MCVCVVVVVVGVVVVVVVVVAVTIILFTTTRQATAYIVHECTDFFVSFFLVLLSFFLHNYWS